MSNPKQLTFPWNKSNKSNFNNFYFEGSNIEAKDALFGSGDIFLYGLEKDWKDLLTSITLQSLF